jgi:hypothetical protein
MVLNSRGRALIRKTGVSTFLPGALAKLRARNDARIVVSDRLRSPKERISAKAEAAGFGKPAL